LHTNHFFKLNYFGTFIGLVSADSDGLFAAVNLPPNSNSGLIFGAISANPILVCLDALLENEMPTSSDLLSPIQKQVRWGDF
jgi:hypothetical protein